MCFEEVEAAAALTALVLEDLGADRAGIGEQVAVARQQALGPGPGQA